MERTRNQMSENQVSSVGVSEEMGRLKSDATATFDELRDFMGEMQGRSAQEALGLVAESGLVNGIVQATIGFAIVLVVFTAIPFFFFPNEPAVTAETYTAAAAKAAEPTNTTDTTQAANAASNDTGDSSATNVEKAANAMGIDETKNAKPNENPLEKKLDNLLDGVD